MARHRAGLIITCAAPRPGARDRRQRAMPRLQPYRMTRTTFLFKNSWMPSSPVSRP